MAINKANVGRMMALHAYNVKTLGKKLMKEPKDNSHVQAVVERYGKLGSSPHREVFSKESSYKSNQEVRKKPSSLLPITASTPLTIGTTIPQT